MDATKVENFLVALTLLSKQHGMVLLADDDGMYLSLLEKGGTLVSTFRPEDVSGAIVYDEERKMYVEVEDE